MLFKRVDACCTDRFLSKFVPPIDDTLGKERTPRNRTKVSQGNKICTRFCTLRIFTYIRQVIRTLRPQDTSAPRHFGTYIWCRSVLGPKCPGAEVSRHPGEDRAKFHEDRRNVINTAGRPKCCRKRCEF